MSYFRSPKWLKYAILELVLLVLPIILFVLNPQSVSAQSACDNSTMTYGDAPSVYGEGCATPSGRLYIGSTAPSAHPFAYPCTTGLADCNPADNFLNPLTPIDRVHSTYTWAVPVTNTTGATAYLSGWIDFSGGGVFDQSRVATAAVPSGGSTVVTLTWTVPITMTPAITTYVRLRLSTVNNAGPTGSYGIGEVEDYAVRTLAGVSCDPGTQFYIIHGSGPSGKGLIEVVTATTGITTFVNNPPIPSSGLPGINGLAVDVTGERIYYQDQADSTVPKGIYGYDIRTNSNFTVTADASTGPLNLPLSNGWQTASGSFDNGKYYAGIDGGDLGSVYEITLDSTGRTPVSARLVIPSPYPPCAPAYCNNYGDVLVVGNRMYIALWQADSNASPGSQLQILLVYDINSALRLSTQTIAASGFAFQLGQDGNGQIYAVTSNDGRIYRVTNGQVVGYPTTGLVSTIGEPIPDAAECLVKPSNPTAVALSTFTALNASNTKNAYDGSPAPFGQITLAWVTGTEVRTAGFNIYRSENPDGPYKRINSQLIPASGSLAGSRYMYQDADVTPGKTYYYQLEDVEYNGANTRHNPISITVATSPQGASGNTLVPIGLGTSAFVILSIGFAAMRKMFKAGKITIHSLGGPRR